MYIRLLILGVMFFSSCSTIKGILRRSDEEIAEEARQRELNSPKAKFERMLNTHIGDSVETLVSAFGPPSSVFEISADKKVFTYAKSDRVETTTSAHTSYFAGNRFIGPTANTTTNVDNTVIEGCKIHFFFNSINTVSSWKYMGNCY